MKWDDTKRSYERKTSTFVVYIVKISSKNYALTAVNTTTAKLWELTLTKKSRGFRNVHIYLLKYSALHLLNATTRFIGHNFIWKIDTIFYYSKYQFNWLHLKKTPWSILDQPVVTPNNVTTLSVLLHSLNRYTKWTQDKFKVLRNVTLCCLTERYKSMRGNSWLYCQGSAKDASSE